MTGKMGISGDKMFSEVLGIDMGTVRSLDAIYPQASERTNERTNERLTPSTGRSTTWEQFSWASPLCR